jgi:hypothetical protein
MATAQTVLDIQGFRYEEKAIEGVDSVDRVQYPLAEKERLDQEAIAEILTELQEGGGTPGGPGQMPIYMMGEEQMGGQPVQQVQEGQDPQAVAAWTFFWRQLGLWQQYIEAHIFYRNLATKANDVLNFEDPGGLLVQLEALLLALREQAGEIDEETHEGHLAYQQRLVNRANLREAYSVWLNGEKELVLEFARQWLRKMRGEEVTIDGNFYLISSEPLPRVPRDAVNIVTNKLTPYDIVNDDGTLKSYSPE